jgi:hypothetical protein
VSLEKKQRASEVLEIFSDRTRQITILQVLNYNSKRPVSSKAWHLKLSGVALMSELLFRPHRFCHGNPTRVCQYSYVNGGPEGKRDLTHIRGATDMLNDRGQR